MRTDRQAAVDGARSWRAAALGLLLLLAGRAFCAEVATGIVVDPAGKPVAGAEVGTAFSLAGALAETRVQISYGDPPAISDATGAFSVPAAKVGYSHVLVAKGTDGTLGFAKREDAVPTRIVLLPPAYLTVQISKRFGQQNHKQYPSLTANGSTVGYAAVAAQPTELLVPQGSLELVVHDVESLTAHRPVVLTAAKPAALSIELQPVWWVRNVGRPAPVLTPTDIRNWPVGKPFATPKGKWVLVTYWATWCKPCVEEMPKLIDFYQRHAALHDRFEILAVHSPDGGESFAAIRNPYERLVKLWGQPVPFPLLFDSTGGTVKRWGVETYPTTLLIDPEGKLAGPGNLEILAAKLGIHDVQAQGAGAPGT